MKITRMALALRDGLIPLAQRTITALALTLSLTACQTASPTMSLEEAKQVTTSLGGAAFVPPPRTIKDLSGLLMPNPAYDWFVEAEIPKYYTRERAAVSYWKSGKALRRMGRFSQAILSFSRAAELVTPEMMISEQGIYEGNRPSAQWANLGMAILRELAQTEGEAGNYRKAIEHLRTAEAVSTRVGRQAWPLYVGSDLVDMYAAIGDLKAVEGVVASIQTLSAHARDYWQGNPIERRVYWQSIDAAAQATLMEMRGQLVEAEQFWRRSIEVLEPQLGNEWVAERFAAQLGRLALCLMKQGRLLEAETEARRALRESNRRPSTYAYKTVKLFMTLGRVLREQGRYSEAETMARAAIAYYEHGGASPISSLAVAEPSRELGAVLASQRRWDQSIQQYSILREQLQDDALYRRLTERDPAIAVSLLRAGRHDEAAAIIAAGLDSSRRNLGDKHPSTAELRGLEAISLAARGDVAAALKEFTEAVTVLLNTVEHVDDDSVSQSEQAQRRTWILAEYIDLLSRARGSAAPPGGRGAVAEAFRIADVARGGIVQRALGAAIARSATTTPALGELARREQDAAKQIAALQTLLATMDDDARDAEPDLRKRIEALQRARQSLLQKIEQKFPAYTELINPRPVTIERARAALRPGEALIATYVGEERTYVWAVTRKGPVAFAVVPLTASAIGVSVATLRNALDSGARTLQEIPVFDVGVAHELYRSILEPVRSGWEPASSLIVVAHGPLARIPWTLLPTRAVPLGAERAPLFSNYRAIPWLVRTHAVTVVPSVATLAALRALPPGDPQRRPFAGFGDPYFSVAHARQESAQRLEVSVHGGLTLRDVAVSPGADVQESRLAMLPRLPDTAEEIRAMARALGADEARDVFLGAAANERNVRTRALNQYRVLAFATHGLVPGDIDGLTQPALALTAPEVANVDGDGLLTMEEILALRLNADWVVLSACNTASGAGAGAEAISGLGRAFFYAGARALLVTLWPVETTSARALTTGLFRRQALDAALTRAMALQQTIIALIDNGGPIDASTGRIMFSYAHPLFWAPFTLVGDGGN